MFGLTLIHKREVALTAGTIADLRAEVERLRKQIEVERQRAEGAINLLLSRTQNAVLTPKASVTDEAEMLMKVAEKMNIFGEGEEPSEKEIEEMQS